MSTQPNELLPCPFCGGSAQKCVVEDPGENIGGHYIACIDCGSSTNLRFACGDDPIPLLVEAWNRRSYDRLAALPVQPEPFQQRVQPWLLACFGAEIASDKDERNHRFLEEALELVQACGCTASEAHQLVDYVFGRAVGEPNQEVGGVMVTLAALCLAQGLDMHSAAETELARIWTKVAQIRAKQAAKPKNSPLPEPTPLGSHATQAQYQPDEQTGPQGTAPHPSDGAAPAVAARDTYDCPIDGVPKPERRKLARGAPNEKVEQLFSGFRNLIGNLKESDPYLHGYAFAMRKALGELLATPPIPQPAAPEEPLRFSPAMIPVAKRNLRAFLAKASFATNVDRLAALTCVDVLSEALEAAQAAPAVPAGWKLLKDSTHAERSWPEDASHENGNYSCQCVDCGRMFGGHKRRAVCKVCAASEAGKVEHPDTARLDWLLRQMSGRELREAGIEYSEFNEARAALDRARGITKQEPKA
jgi:hypothetical protein